MEPEYATAVAFVRSITVSAKLLHWVVFISNISHVLSDPPITTTLPSKIIEV